VKPGRPATLLAEVRQRAADHQEAQVRRVAKALGCDVRAVTTALEEIVDRVEIRITRSLSVGRSLMDELEAGQVPTIRSVFETSRQDHTEDSITIAGIVSFRREQEAKSSGPTRRRSRSKIGLNSVSLTSLAPRRNRCRSDPFASC
jgi:hypothetical protein